ncbi:sensor histidine kinase [Streptomyces smaragdinus]|nr:ATP-binding protein [Streptomyces smaragdinus]
MRLTLLYALLFLVSGLVLTTLVLFVVFREPILVTFEPAPPVPPDPLGGDGPLDIGPLLPKPIAVSPTWGTVRRAGAQAGLVLGVMAFVSAALGWVVAGRVLSPLRTMTARTHRISERNLHERLALTGPHDEMTELADTIDGLLARLESAFEAQRRFVANASHELRTPLAMMRTSVDVAVGKPTVPPPVTVLAGKVREGLDAADRLLEGLLLLARAQAGRPETADVDATALVDAAVTARAAAVEERGLTIESRLIESAVVRGNATLLASLVDNLVDNAVLHNEPGGWIGITVDRPGAGATIRLVVENGGPVLDRRAVAALGQPFQRIGRERTARPGSGLGLSIVAAIAAAHGGRLLLTARADGGLRAEVEL